MSDERQAEHSMIASEVPDRNLALELVRVTEAAAMAAARWVGRGDKNGADGAAVNAMRALIGSVSMNGVVVIGEGEKDDAPMLFNGERVGDGTGAEADVAVDPIDGTTLAAKGMPNAIAVIAVAERGAMFDPSAVFYMEKMVAGPDCVGVVDITAPIERNLAQIAKAKGEAVGDLTVCILDRPRHESLVKSVREAGARIKFITDGDVAGAIMASTFSSGSAAPPRASSPRARWSAWEASSKEGSGHGMQMSGARPSMRGTTSTGCSRRATLSRARTSSSAQRASPTANSSTVSGIVRRARSRTPSSCAR